MVNSTVETLGVVRERLGEEAADLLLNALSTSLRAPMDAEANTQAGAPTVDLRWSGSAGQGSP